MDNLDITMEEYIKLEAEKARKRGQTFNWETGNYGKLRYHEDINYFQDLETDFSAIDFDDPLATNHKISSEPTVSLLDDNEIDFRISFDESDDEDYTLIYDRNSFSCKLNLIWHHYHPGLKGTSGSDMRSRDTLTRSSKISRRGWVLFTSHAWRRLFEIQGPLVCEFMLEFFSTCKISDTVLELDAADTLCFQLGGVSHSMSWRQIASDGDFLEMVPSYTSIRNPLRRLYHRLIAVSIFDRRQSPDK
ncbi:hypothetical protein Tco_0320676 [Tanacetum coccineum]